MFILILRSQPRVLSVISASLLAAAISALGLAAGPAGAAASASDGSGSGGSAVLSSKSGAGSAPEIGDARVSRGGQSARGGLVVPGNPRIDDVVCVRQCVSARRATPGATVRISGGNLNRVKRIVFPGKGKRIKVRYRTRTRARIEAVVPKKADDGRPFVVDSSGSVSNRAPRELEVLPVSRIPVEVFPVRGPYDYGSAGARFGAGRSGYAHQGQDIMAACGTRLVSVKRARVVYNRYHSAAGNYVVLKNLGTNTYFAYMHLRKPSTLRVGQRVGAGTPVGRVGETGRAYGCHLHFEYWVGPWQTGGRPIDPLPYLKSL